VKLTGDDLISRLFGRHMSIGVGLPIVITNEEFYELRDRELQREMLSGKKTYSDLIRWCEENNITGKHYLFGREVIVESKEEHRIRLTQEIRNCPECQAKRRWRHPFPWKECDKHREALRQLDAPKPPTKWRVGSKVPNAMSGYPTLRLDIIGKKV